MTRPSTFLAAIVLTNWLGYLIGEYIGYHVGLHPEPEVRYITDPAVCRLAVMEDNIARRAGR